MITKSNSAKILATLLLSQGMPLHAMAMNIGSNDAKANLSAPVYAKLGNSKSDTIKPDPDLSPVKLGSSENSATIPDITEMSSASKTEHEAESLNAKIEEKGFVPKPPIERADNVVGEESVVSAKDKKKQAKADAYEKSLRDAANRVGPSELQPSDKEVHEKVLTILEAEKAELAEIWDAALCRSQDIQFIVQKLMPTKDPKHSTAVMMKMLSTAMYGTVAATSMVSGSAGQGGGMLQSAGTSMIMSVFNQVNAHSNKKIAMTQTDAIMLYKTIKDLGREVAHDFHDYKKSRNQVARACSDYDDLQKMVAEARVGQDAYVQIQMEFLLRKNRREIDGLNEDARNSRDALVTIAGTEAVDSLDKQIDDESEKIGLPRLAQDDDAQEENKDGKALDKASGKKEIARAVKRKKEPIDATESRVKEPTTEEDAVDDPHTDKSQDKAL